MVEEIASTLRARPEIEQTLDQAIRIIRPDFHIGIDLALAIFPLLLALIIFRRSIKITPLLWWPLLGVFILFLPNSPYVLTDVIHFVAKVRVTPPLPIWAMSLLLLEYFVYFLFGMQCFTVSVMILGRFLRRHQTGWLVFPMEITIIALSSFAMYLGRIDRLNSWNIVTDPHGLVHHAVNDASSAKPIELTVLFFCAVSILYYFLKGWNHLVAGLFRHHSSHQEAVP
ncbi:MAG: DUF1361 domain-containing protein [Chthoniobacterales bacterium]